MSELTGLLAIWYREFKVFTREKSRVISSVLSPLFFLIIFGAGLDSSVSIEGISYQQFIYPGIISMALLFTSIYYGVYIVWDKMIDFLKEVLVAPLSRTTIFLGKVLGGVTDAVIQGTLLIGIGFFLNINFNLWGLPFAFLIMIITSAGLVGVGLLIGSLMERPEGFQLIGSFLLFPLFLLSGALFPIDDLPSWLAPFTYADPLTYCVDALRVVLLDAGQFPLYFDLTVLTLFAIGTTILGTLSFRRMKL
ncbi:MAG TPA: ABC transporter permease [Nitrososphaerales archaeon]|nr:ABC transporter permease [Nitrososphaerales archaeon]